LAEFAFKQLRWGVKSRAWARFHPVRLGIFPRYSQAGGPVVSGRPPMPTGVLVPHVVADLVRSDTPSGYQTTGATSATAGITAWAGGRLSRRSRSILTALTSCFVYPVPGCATESSGVYGQDYGQRCVHCAGFRPHLRQFRESSFDVDWRHACRKYRSNHSLRWSSTVQPITSAAAWTAPVRTRPGAVVVTVTKVGDGERTRALEA